ncbi:VTT domain-containing protein [Microdochium nivale]|nr:VTT domain-containing protein [Microdochium nivale]
MPAGYASAARALELPTSPLSEDATSPRPLDRSDSNLPLWARSSNSSNGGGGARRPGTAVRRLSTPYSRPDRTPFGRRILQYSLGMLNKALRLFYSLTPVQQALAVLAGLATVAVSIVFLIYSHRIFAWLQPIAVGWRALPAGWLIIFAMTFAAAFPPMIGYSTCLTISGFVYGFPGGWPVSAIATVAGSTAAFIASRTVLSRYVHALIGSDKRFVALGQILRRDGVFVLAAVRLCPLPFSLSNGFLATIPSIGPVGFAAATALASPKIFIHIFIGSRMAKLAESGDTMGLGDKIINYASMVFGGVLGTVLGLVIYRRTMARAEELMREDGAAEDGEAGSFLNNTGGHNSRGGSSGGGSGGGRMGGFSGPGVDYADLDDATELQDPDVLDAALMDADDISLWAADGVSDQVYRDDDGRRSASSSSRSGSSQDSPVQATNPRRSPVSGRSDEEADSTIRAVR